MKFIAKLSVRKTKKGLVGELSWQDEKGKSKHMTIPSGLVTTLELNDKECEVELESGKIFRIVVEGKDLLQERQPTPPKQKSDSSKSPNQHRVSSSREQKTATDAPKRQDFFKTSDTDRRKEVYDVRWAKLPRDTQAEISDNIENFYLQMNKAAPFLYEETRNGLKEIGFKIYHQDRNKNVMAQFDPRFSKDQIDALLQRQEESIKSSGPYNKKIEGGVDWRLIVGLGHSSVYETSITLHFIYGFPYIPGSAVKGVTRSWVIAEKFNQCEEGALNDPVFQVVFGHLKTQQKNAHKGFVIFHDAFPTSSPQIATDVMNPHYGPYYSDPKGKTPPADYHSPVPVPFLTVQNTAFRFYLSVHDRSEQLKKTEAYKPELVLEQTKEWLSGALKNHGIGAKTAVGYGYMNLK